MNRNISSYTKYLPFVAALYAIYEAYGSRGLQGFINDFKALPGILKNQEAQKQLIMGIVIIVLGSVLVSKFATRGWLKHASYAAIYYFAISQIATAVRSGAGRYGGSVRQMPYAEIRRR